MSKIELKPVAAVITEWRKNSHADVILSRLLEPEAWGHARPFGIKLVAIYADQFPANDLCRPLCAKHGVPIFDSVQGCVGVGTRGVPVEGVLLIGEHGTYPHNQRGQHLYPRRRLFAAIVDAFRALGRRVPVFSDKHLSYDWGFARGMVELAKHEGFPLLAGSSLPVGWRVPNLNLPMGVELARALSIGYSDLDAYGFHAIETLQCMVERRKGGETGVASVRCLSGDDVWSAEGKTTWGAELLEAFEPARLQAQPKAAPFARKRTDAVFLIEYTDGLKAATAMLDGMGQHFGYVGRRSNGQADATAFELQEGHPFGHFGYLTHAIEQLVTTGKAPYPVERTLLTTGILASALQSRFEGGTLIRTPHLESVQYTPVDWPHATGKVGTPVQ